jgi:drug/metabolite transporter (DMT)-like permease
LKEVLSARQVLGLAMVVVAGICISLKKIEGSIFFPRKSLWLMLLSSLMYGSIAVLFRFVSRDSNFWADVSYQYIGTGLGGVLLMLFPRVRHGFTIRLIEIKKSIRVITMSHTLGLLAQLSESLAVTMVAVPLVHIIWSIQPVIVFILGTALTVWFPHIIKEDIKRAVVAHKLVSVALMFCGLFLVYF